MTHGMPEYIVYNQVMKMKYVINEVDEKGFFFVSCSLAWRSHVLIS